MDATHATKYATKLLELFELPVQQQAVVIGSATIRDKNGCRWPLWRVITNNGGYMRFLDLNPHARLSASLSGDRLTSFRIAAMDYTYRDNLLRIVPDLPDSRLDSILNQAGLIAGQLVSTAPELAPASIADGRQRILPFGNTADGLNSKMAMGIKPLNISNGPGGPLGGPIMFPHHGGGGHG
jgi:hypothetical protein